MSDRSRDTRATTAAGGRAGRPRPPGRRAGRPTGAVALAFAATAFPCKPAGRCDPDARDLGDAELRLRVAAFAGFLAAARDRPGRVAAAWRTEAPLVRFVRTAVLSPPSQLAGRAGLAATFPGTPADVLDPGRVGDAVAGFWEGIVRDRLRSGFPYYGSRSRVRTWWNQCLFTRTESR